MGRESPPGASGNVLVNRRRHRFRRTFDDVIGCLPLILAICLVLFLLGAGWVPEAGWRLLFGWSSYIAKSLPQVTVNWELLGCGLAALALSLLLGHRFLRWFAGQEKTPLPSPWPFRGTLALTFLLLLFFGASIAMTGIVHQSAWMIRSKERLFVDGRLDPVLINSAHASQYAHAFVRELLGKALELGRFPSALSNEFMDWDQTSFEALAYWHPKRESLGEPWLYLVANLRVDEVLPKTPVFVQPRPDEQSVLIVAYADGTVHRETWSELPQGLRELFPESKPSTSP